MASIKTAFLMVLLAIPASAQMQGVFSGVLNPQPIVTPTFTAIQGKYYNPGYPGSSLTMVLTLASAPATGHAVLCGFDVYTGAATAPTVSIADGNSNAYTITPSSPESTYATTAGFLYLAYLQSAPSNASATITVTSSLTIVAGDLRCNEFSDSAGTQAFDKDIPGSGSSGTAINSPGISPTNTGSLLYGYTVAPSGITSANSPWTQDLAGISTADLDGEYILSSSSGTTDINFTSPSSTTWEGMAISFAP